MIEYNIKDEKHFTIIGSMASKEKGIKRMLDEDLNLLKTVNDRAARHALNSAGMQVRFQTNSTVIRVKVKLLDKSNMNNMSSMGQSGIDIYVYHKELKKYVFQNISVYERHMLEYDVNLIKSSKRELNSYIINLPLYNSVEEVLIYLDEEAISIPYAKQNNDNILFYGTSIVQGGTVSRAGLLYSNIISRKIENEIFNFGFSGAAFLEKEMAEIISKVDNPKLLIIDAEPNAGVDNSLKDNTAGFIDVFRKHHPTTPILVCSRISYAFDLMNEEIINRKKSNYEFLKNYVNEKSKNDENIFFVDGKEVFGEDFFEYTVDGVHPNDLGAMRLADFYYEEIKKHI